MLTIDKNSVKISIDSEGVTAAGHVGKMFALLHLSKGANLAAGDSMPAGKVNNFNAIEIKASVDVGYSDKEIDLGDLKFGIVQVARLDAYRLVYAGRLASDGSVVQDLKAGFTKNPGLDAGVDKGKSIDDVIFGNSFFDKDAARKVFVVQASYGDHPNNSIPLTFQNKVSASLNYLASAERSEFFETFFVTRTGNGPLMVLASIGWSVSWNIELVWKTVEKVITPQIVQSRNNIISAFTPKTKNIDVTTPEALIAAFRTLPTIPAQQDTVNKAVDSRKSPVCIDKKDRPEDLRSDFFP